MLRFLCGAQGFAQAQPGERGEVGDHPFGHVIT